MRAVFRLLLATLLAALAPADAFAQRERIASFDAVVIVEPTGELHVTESITAVAAGAAIKRGIFRSLIIPERGWLEASSGPAYRVASARRGASPEPWRTQSENGMFTVYLGSKDALLEPGTHAYTLSYEARSQVRRFEGYDELYWNVTGNNWAFPVERASIVVMLPPDAKALQFTAYTGPMGFKGKDYTVRQDGPGRLVFETTRALAPGEGFTVAVAWPKGFVAQAGWRETALSILRGNPYLAASAAGLALTMLAFVAAWIKVGRDPAPGVVVPLFAPPRGMSPAAVRFVTRMGHDSKDLACTVVGLAVTGALSITEEDKGDFTLARAENAPDPGSMEEDEALKALFKDGRELEVKRASRASLTKAREALRKSLDKSYTGYLFNPNLGWFAPGAALAALTVASAALSGDDWRASAFIMVWLSVWTLGTTLLLSRVAATWRDALTGRETFLKLAGALFVSAFALPFLLGEVAGLVFLGFATSPFAAAIVLATATACAAFHHLLKAPTAEGRQVMDQIEGFKLYLTVAEEERLNLLNPPEETPELFERFLPYAMALDVENRWGERFEGVLASAAQAPDGYSPVWYHGPHWDASSPGGFCGGLSSGFSSALSSSTSSSSGSPGSGGGGSSGGGGGGGGGGGW